MVPEIGLIETRIVVRSIFTQRLELFPITTHLNSDSEGGRLTIAGCNLDELVAKYGTPLYLYDKATLDDRVDVYQRSLARHYPGKSGLTYAGKAFLCTAMAQWVKEKGLLLDCTGAGEIHIALNGGLEPQDILVHGINKSKLDIDMAIAHTGIIVVDNLSELDYIAKKVRRTSESLPHLWLRIRPGVQIDTHKHIQTGYSDSKFGVDLSEISQAIKICLNEGLPLTGLHFHLGSQIKETRPIVAASEAVFNLLSTVHKEYGWLPEVICPGGGLAVAYHEDDLPHPSIDCYVSQISETIISMCKRHDFPLPILRLEPGRSLVARAGVAIYDVGGIKKTANRNWILLDGGLADNPRPALYSVRYSALPISQPNRPANTPMWFGGPYCESGDVLIEGLIMPEVQPGELIAVPVSGAYQLSMSSNYNGALKPAVLWLEKDRAQLIQERETVTNLTRRDHRLIRS